jgi:hypothetical protein
MKGKIFAALAIGAIAFVSCKKEEPATPAEPGTATVQGTLWANTNLDNDTDQWGFYMETLEYTKSGVLVTAVIDSEDLDENPEVGYNYQDLKWTTTTGANGAYSFTGLPARNWPIAVELRFNDYTDSQLSGGVVDPSVTFTMNGVSQWVWIYDGAVVIAPDWAYDYM